MKKLSFYLQNNFNGRFSLIWVHLCTKRYFYQVFFLFHLFHRSVVHSQSLDGFSFFFFLWDDGRYACCLRISANTFCFNINSFTVFARNRLAPFKIIFFESSATAIKNNPVLRYSNYAINRNNKVFRISVFAVNFTMFFCFINTIWLIKRSKWIFFAFFWKFI